MKYLYILLFCISLAYSSASQLSQVIVDEVEHTGNFPVIDGMTSYRIFAQLESPQSYLSAVYGDINEPLNISTSTEFFTSPLVPSAQGNSNNEFFWGIFPELQYVSYVTIGYASHISLGIPYSESSIGLIPIIGNGSLGTAGDTDSDWIAPFLDGNDIIINQPSGGAWFSFDGDANNLGVGVNNSVLLGQFTTDGDFSYNINVQVFLPGEDETEEFFYYWQDNPGLGLSYNGSTCSVPEACNYNPDVADGEGLCFYPGDSCSDGNSLTGMDVLQDDCSCQGLPLGCMDESACNFDLNALLDNESCYLPGDSCDDGDINTTNDIGQSDCSCLGQLLGCTDPTACNFEEDAEVDNDSCFFVSETCNDGNLQTTNDLVQSNCSCEGQLLGCTDPTACNYDEVAEVDNNSCYFSGDYCSTFNTNEIANSFCECEHHISGQFFVDDNFNGMRDPLELALPYQTATLNPGNVQIITDDEGWFSFIVEEGEYTVTGEYSADWSELTTPTSYDVSTNFNISNLMFGVTNEETPDPSACADFYSSGFGIPCNDNLNYNICWRNMSPYPISGVVEVQMDDLMTLNYTNPTHDSIVGQSVFWTYENLNPWEMRFDDINMYTPDETNIGEYVTNSVIIHTWWEGELIPITEKVITQEVTCAYDPNDITGFPFGYTDEHWVLPDTRMEYLIRFQNTGNAPAGTVRVVDTLDMDMDWSSFELMANSHSVMTTIEQETGRVEFLFEDINLPDSVANEPESHGLVSFKINFNNDVAIGEEINQTAYIFFDNNPAVVTNTTWHTIHECGGEGAFEASATEICVGEEVSFTSSYPQIEDYEWNLDSQIVGYEENLSYAFTEAGDYEVRLAAENPVCLDSTVQTITVYDLPQAEITENGAILTVSESNSYQWYQNGELIENANSQTYEVTVDGTFSVVVTNVNGCSTHSAEVMIVNVSELTQPTIVLYPNPMTNVATLEIEGNQSKTITLVDSQGKEVRSWQNVTDQRLEIQKGELSSGTYFINVQFVNGTVQTLTLVMK